MVTLATAVNTTDDEFELSAALASTTEYLLVDDELVAVITPGIRSSQRVDPSLRAQVLRNYAGTLASHAQGATLTELAAPPLGVPAGEDVVTVLRASVELTDAQIKATPGDSGLFEIVPAPGAGFAYHVLGGMGVLRVSAGAYTNIDAADSACCLRIGTFDRASQVLPNTQFSSAFGATNNVVLRFSQPSDNTGTPGRMVSADTIVHIEDKAINLELYNNLGALTGGNAANSLTVTVWYDVVTL